MLLLSLLFIGSFVAPIAASAQNLGTAPQFGQAVQGQQATTVEGTVLNIVNWGCNVIAPVIAVACLGIAGWHFKSGRGYMGWGVSGVALRGDEHADKYADLETHLLPFVRMAKQTLRCAGNGVGTSYRCSIGPPFASREFLPIAA